jgi:hypothetical protein
VLAQVRVDELGKRQSSCDPAFSSKPLKLPLERIARVLLGGEAAVLNTLGVATARAVAIRPQRSPLVPRRRSSNVCPCCTIALGSLLSGVDPLPAEILHEGRSWTMAGS